MAIQDSSSSKTGSVSAASLIYDPKVRGIFYQVVTLVILVAFIWMVANNTIHNLQKANITSGFGFLQGRSGFDIGQQLISYSSDSTYGRALLVGLLNTLQVAVAGIITASIIGFAVGLGRLSHNWLIAKLCQVYVEIFRNIPPLLVIFFWYRGVIAILPQARDSIALPFDIYLNNRGVTFPKAIFGDEAWLLLPAIAIGIVLSILVRKWARKRQMATGQQFPILWSSLALIVGLPVLVFMAIGMPLTFDLPIVGRFNMQGGSVVGPEFTSLFLALSFYTAAFIAEIVRGGIKAVSKGQTEAASALGLKHSHTSRLIVVPQAMRIIIPPLTSQYLNLAKNSSLAVAIGFADIVAVGGTILNQTGQAVEIVAVWLAVYLTISISTAVFMNWFNAKMALVER
ncbi:amino acid ABC transporter permease [Agrobacterium vitis]|uniref:amino acid ABC transporter permease n=1 Tax=Agrobacterium vitis TaxID=373 RepID=UPI00087299E4|nr:amino acid ABC transporter permease [Agrobacterium vitis]MCE6073531.1 ABC transporter permease subunit [Agrobacterium vitis]MCM2453101.1 amino acid ABC transporter permease [Agrobacterium vitis]MCM2469462.1 amino acid ABC transporter permease [Agrobacterium vitis]MUO69065.1 ABC transporter permease subunit [Agrobacterium vitis]MUO83615.1 ABC transporter permease subunit [Agrobacterium vitis]